MYDRIKFHQNSLAYNSKSVMYGSLELTKQMMKKYTAHSKSEDSILHITHTEFHSHTQKVSTYLPKRGSSVDMKVKENKIVGN